MTDMVKIDICMYNYFIKCCGIPSYKLISVLYCLKAKNSSNLKSNYMNYMILCITTNLFFVFNQILIINDIFLIFNKIYLNNGEMVKEITFVGVL